MRLSLEYIKEDLAKAEHLYAVAVSEYKSTRRELREARAACAATQQAREVLQKSAKALQQVAHKKIASLVTKCLASVMDEPYEFKIHFEEKRGKTEARMVFLRNGLEVDPLTAAGGGAVDIAAFALRLSCISLSQPKLRKLLVMDEPFRFVSKNLRQRLRLLIEQLAEEMGFQIVMITHIQDFETGSIINLSCNHDKP